MSIRVCGPVKTKIHRRFSKNRRRRTSKAFCGLMAHSFPEPQDDFLQTLISILGKNCTFVVETYIRDYHVGREQGFAKTNLYQFAQFYKCFPDIFHAVSGKSLSLAWTHYRALLRVTDDAARNWYMNEAISEGWSSRTLDRNIASQYYYRLLQSQAKEAVRDEMQALTADFQNDKLEFIKNPVVAEFLGLSPNSDFTETKLEASIITHIQKFVMELGKGYAFVARQQHIRTDMGDYFIDLVFYNYILKCFLLVDLKTSRITHQDVGQMDMYVRMYDQLKRTEGDNPTIGLILCSETSEDMARYSVMHDNERLFQAKYLTYLPTVEQLREEIELQKSVFQAQQGE